MDTEALRGGDPRALARAISAIEEQQAWTGDLIHELAAEEEGQARTHLVGVTGAPGSGKSTLVDALTSIWRGQGRRVAVLAVDPNSPFTGGAILGDRVRMQRHALDRGVFIRSMGARGHLGGVSLATRATSRLLQALGWEMVVVETVGVGQSELEICEIADSVVLVTTPAAGDGVQVIKAGITEIADIFAVNKADLSGVDGVVRELRQLIRSHTQGGWEAPVLATVASSGPEGAAELAEALERHRQHLDETGERGLRASRRRRDEVVELVGAYATGFARRQPELEVAAGDASEPPERLARRLLGRMAAEERNMGSAGAPPGSRGVGDAG